jgi:hypothetical protein
LISRGLFELKRPLEIQGSFGANSNPNPNP